MKSRIPAGLAMMVIALMLSLVPATAATTLPARALSSCDRAQFIADVTVPDGTNVLPGLKFTKTWRLKNIGSCSWTSSYALVFASGDALGGTSVNLPNTVAPGQTVDISVSLTAPSTAGHYIGFWQFKNASGTLFGIGTSGDKAWWVDINVLNASTYSVAYDFAANYCSAAWYSIQGSRPCPGTEGDSGGFVLKADNPQLENGTFADANGLILRPQNVYNGDIHGTFPTFRVQTGDRFRSVVGCAYQAADCFVTFRLDYQIGNGPIQTYWSLREKYEGLVFRTDLDLSPLAGQDVKFILTVLATGPASADRAVWSNPVIARADANPPPPPASCDRAQFVADVTVPDGTTFAPGRAFTKTWRFKNVGTCTWSTSYAVVFDSGEKMGGPDLVNMPKAVAPGQTVDVSVNLKAPDSAASYRGYWKFQNASSVRFGIGTAGTKAWWVDIRVAGVSTGRNYDFGTASSPLASGYSRVTETTAFAPGGYGWTDTSGLESRDRSAASDALKRDFVMNSSAARIFKIDLPNGAYSVTLTMGDNDFAHDNMLVKANGATVLADVDSEASAYAAKSFTLTISTGSLALEFSDEGGTDPTWVVNAVSIVPASPPPAGCDRAQFVADVTVPDGTVFTPGAQFDKTWRLKNVGTCTWTTSYAMVFGTGERMGGASPIAMPVSVAPGSSVDVKIHLTAPGTAGSYRGYWKFQNAGGAAFGIGADAAKSWWVDIKVSGAAATATPTASPTPIPTATGTSIAPWNTYVNGTYSFSFRYPPEAITDGLTDAGGRLTLPIAPGTNLVKKWLDVSVAEGVSPCKAPGSNPQAPSENVTINGFQFLKEKWDEGVTSHRADITAYSRAKGNACISLSFVLWSVVPEVLTTPPPVFDRDAESAVFTTIMSTYAE